tara:strand:+ start:333 stop:1148 length:816 start_codon:yes stop_codon:yes gene_type:complete
MLAKILAKLPLKLVAKLVDKAPQLSWDLDLLLTEVICDTYSYGIPRPLRQANYSISLVRFWFIYHFLLAEHANREILDIAVLQHRQLDKTLKFIIHASAKGYPPVRYRHWQLFEESEACEISEICEIGEGRADKADIKKGTTTATGNYDVFLVYSDAENIETLEALICYLKKRLRSNGIVIGVVSKSRSGIYQHLRVRDPKNNARNSLSITEYLYEIAKKAGYSVDFLSGAYYGRNQGLVPKQHKFFFRCNLFMGSLLPGRAGELYWVFRK